ncbi:MAG: hypothetical protein LBF64_02825 [Oscillospiraceae bacterium]|jgi:hypothetical protein|nr:hypothetical protein [Oscillospiraceae bacterium]
MSTEFFLGANTPAGFYSLYDGLIDLDTAREVIVLKGSPGCGKSTFMRRVGALVAAAGHSVESILCSSDPDSLDGVIFPGLKAAVVDGTAPHVVEPVFPLAVERYCNLGAHCDIGAVKAHRADIQRLIRAIRPCYARATRCLSAARALEDDMFNCVLSGAALDTLARRARGIISREIRPGSGAALTKRFLSAITPRGLLCRYETAHALCPRLYELNDDYGLAHMILSPILEAALAAGQEAIACYSPMNPAHQLEHVLLPGLGVGFVSSGRLHAHEGKPFRRLRLNACLDPEPLRRLRVRLRFLHKTERALLGEAVDALAEAKRIHDELEDCYRPHMDFASVNRRADQIAACLLQEA